jgi:arylsulfatase A-like enzyme
MQSARRLVAVMPLCLAAACTSRPQPGPVTLRLTDLYKPELVSARVAPSPPPPRTEWRFDRPAGKEEKAEKPDKNAATFGWDAFSGISGLTVRNGRLAGKTTTDAPLLHIGRPPAPDPDPVQEVEVRLRVSAGSKVEFGFASQEKMDPAKTLGYLKLFGAEFSSPVVPGDEMRTYILKTNFNAAGVGARHLFLRPSDQPGATFEVESIRVVTRKEHLAGVASGLGWQGLSEIYRETLVTRSPEVLKFDLTLPSRPLLDLAVGTVEDSPVTFRVAVQPAGGEETIVLERTVTRPYRWQAAPVDLAAFAGRPASLRLSLVAEKPGTLGFWGGPVVRSQGAMPAPATDRKAPADAPQGVILVWADTLRRDHLSAYGYKRPTSPVLERLAKEGALFADCVGQASWTKVATPSMMSSLYPTSNGVLDFPDRLASSATTLAEAYRDAGYATVSYSSILFTGKFTNLHQGFEEVHEDSSLPDRNSSKTAREYVDRLLPWLQAHREVPFFVFLHVSDPHDPYRPYPPYDTMWADPARDAEHERQSKEVKAVIEDPLLKAFGMPTRDELVKAKIDPDAYADQDRGFYDGSIRGMDAEIGRLVEGLRGLGLDRKAVLVFTGDHGEEFFDHGRGFHGQSVYGEMNNLPLIVWGPGFVRPGLTVEDTVQTLDLMPTLLELSRIRVPAEAQGHSLLGLLAAAGDRDGVRAAAPATRPAISEKNLTQNMGGPPPRDTAAQAIVLGGWKLIHNTKAPAGKPEFELFDHAKDPLDRNDVAAAHPDVVQRLRQQLEGWQKMATAARLKPDALANQNLSKEELERLRSLGYVQ